MCRQIECFLTLRYLRGKSFKSPSVITVFSVIGIALSVATLIIVLSVMNGFRIQLFSKILGVNGHIYIEKMQPVTERSLESIKSDVLALPEVSRVYNLIEGQAYVTSSRAGSGVYIRGMSASDLQNFTFIKQHMVAGSFPALSKGDGVLIGSGLAHLLGVTIGDQVSLMIPGGDITPFGYTPRIKVVNIQGIYKVGMTEIDTVFMLASHTLADTLLSKRTRSEKLEIFVDDPYRLDQVEDKLAEWISPGMWITDWRNKNSNFYSALKIERNVMFLILSLMVLIATLNIVSGLILLVRNKVHDIAILKTMGATSTTIMFVFMSVGLCIGLIGTVLGLCLGIYISLNIASIQTVLFPGAWDPTVRFLSTIPSKINWIEVVWVTTLSMVLSLIATLYPSYIASRLDPAEALRSSRS